MSSSSTGRDDNGDPHTSPPPSSSSSSRPRLNGSSGATTPTTDSEDVEYDAEVYEKLTRVLLEKLQVQGDNCLMDDLLEAAAGTSEWCVQRVLDVLMVLGIVGCEKQNGNENRGSRAYTYRGGYTLGFGIPLEKLRSQINTEEIKIIQREERIKRLKLRLASSPDAVEDAKTINETMDEMLPQ